MLFVACLFIFHLYKKGKLNSPFDKIISKAETIRGDSWYYKLKAKNAVISYNKALKNAIYRVFKYVRLGFYLLWIIFITVVKITLIVLPFYLLTFLI